jgi:DnaK suppressor protein
MVQVESIYTLARELSMNLQAQKKALLNEQARLRKDIEVTAPIVNSDHPGYSTHMADDASEVFEQEQNAMVHGQLQWLLSEVEHALAKIVDSTFGRCEACGKPIHPARLEALPTARFCMEDQEKLEKKVNAP